MRPATALPLLLALAGCPSTTERLDLPPVQTVETVDLDRYVGTWYEIASFPQRFQEGCAGTTAEYSFDDDGGIRVVNRCFDEALTGPERVAEGRARLPDPSAPARLEVSFFGPFWGDYWVLDLDDDYQFAVVGHPGRDYLWVLSRTPQLDPVVYQGILDRLHAQRYATDRLVLTLQPTEQGGSE